MESDDRCEYSRRSTRHCRRPAHLQAAALRAVCESVLDRRTRRFSHGSGILCNQVCSLGNLGRIAAGIDGYSVTIISPGNTKSELASTITDSQAARWVEEFRDSAIPADAIARAIAFAIKQPADVDVNEIIVRPIGQSG